MNALTRHKRLSPLQNALLWMGFSTVLMWTLFVMVPPNDMRPGAGVFLVVVVLAITASAYWARRREVAGLPPFFFAQQRPLFAGAAAFLLVGALSALFVWFTDLERNPLLYGAYMGTAMGVITYQHRRTGENSFRSFLVVFVPLAIVYVLIAAYLRTR